MSEIDISSLIPLIGTKVDRVEPGIGSFLNIYSKSERKDEEYQLWIYLAQWAITKGGIEVLASDKSQINCDTNYGDLLPSGVVYRDIISIDHEEVKVVFSNGINLELWGDAHAYGAGSIMAHIYLNGNSVGNITLRDA